MSIRLLYMIVGIRFRPHGQLYYFSSEIDLFMDDGVVVETEQGIGYGRVCYACETLSENVVEGPIIPILRKATAEDCQAGFENEELAKQAFQFCKNCIVDRGLDMKLVDVEVFFDRSKIIFYFTAPARIDFRELVKDLVREYRARIELRQIGVRHETQMVGAVGNCGMVCCCRRYLRKFAPVTIRMAKEQNLFLNPAKISGICSRLLCCLSFEQENYDNFHNQCPKLGKKYQTDMGDMKVLRANMFRNTVSLLNERNEEVEMTLEEWQDIKPNRTESASKTPQKQQQNQHFQGDGLLVVTVSPENVDELTELEDFDALMQESMQVKEKRAPQQKQGSGIFGLAPQKQDTHKDNEQEDT